MIEAFQRLDKSLCTSIDNHIQPVMVLEEIETGSLKLWLKNLLTAIDDQALKDIDWRPAVGKYLVKGKYIIIRWLNEPTNNKKSLVNLGDELKHLANETDVKILPDYAPPSIKEIADAIKDIDIAKNDLIEGDKLSYISPDKDPIDFDLGLSLDGAELEDMIIKDREIHENMSMNLIVKKPDYLGVSKWDFRHGRHIIQANIHDEEWLKNFHNREFDIRPGDALKCKVTIEYSYGYDSELLKETYTVTSVTGILANQVWQQTKMNYDDDT